MILACGFCGGQEATILAWAVPVVPVICGTVGFCLRCIAKKFQWKKDECKCECHDKEKTDAQTGR